MTLRIGEIYRYARDRNPASTSVDGLLNYFHETYTAGHNLPLLEAGINPIGKINAVDGERCPAILISSNPHRIGSKETPWQDFFDPDNGHIHYFGDNKWPSRDPSIVSGNKTVLFQFEVHNSFDRAVREKSTPMIFFKRVKKNGRPKGNVEFQGFGIVSEVHRVVQIEPKTNINFTNYAFDFVVFSLFDENEEFDWRWISARRDPDLTLGQTLRLAPSSWKSWIALGSVALEICRRRVSKLSVVNTAQQRPDRGSREARALNTIYSFYDTRGRKKRFEALASIVTSKVIDETGTSYHEGWITPGTGDHGADFIGRLDVGSDFTKTKLIVLGQAKCEKLDSPTGGNHIARTVARLKRGWIGVYVTTSYYSNSVQREVIEDKYPIVLIHGLRLAQEVLKMTREQGYPDVTAFLEHIDSTYNSKVMRRDPEEILYD